MVEVSFVRCMSLDLTDKSTLVQVMAWCCQATSHYLSQCWPRSRMPYGVTRTQWVDVKFWVPISWSYNNLTSEIRHNSSCKMMSWSITRFFFGWLSYLVVEPPSISSPCGTPGLASLWDEGPLDSMHSKHIDWLISPWNIHLALTPQELAIS